jgi:hypothetical protein
MAKAEDWQADTIRTVEIEIPRDEVDWYNQHRVYPVEAQIRTRTREVTIGERKLRYHPLAEGRYAVTVGTRTLSIGEFDATTVRRTINDEADRDVRAVRAAVLQLPYEVPVAFKLTNNKLVHPGECWQEYSAKNLKAVIATRLTHVETPGLDDLDDKYHLARPVCCAHCKETFE